MSCTQGAVNRRFRCRVTSTQSSKSRQRGTLAEITLRDFSCFTWDAYVAALLEAGRLDDGNLVSKDGMRRKYKRVPGSTRGEIQAYLLPALCTD